MTPDSLSRAIENAIERYVMSCELRDREAALADSQEQLALALESANLMVFTWDIRTDQVRRLLSQVPGLPSSNAPDPGPSTFAEVASVVHPEDRERFTEEVQNALQDEGEYYNQFRVGSPGGPILWLEERGRVTFDPSGTPIRLIGVTADVTERKEREQALWQRDQELQSLADNTPDILSRFDRDLRHVFVNAAVLKATGRPASDFIGRTNRELGMPEHLCELWEEASRSVFETGQPRTIEFDFNTVGGTRHYLARLVPEFGPNGEIEHILGVTHDLTLETQAVKASARRTG